MRMVTCSRCGDWIDFITLHGRRIPIHQAGQCAGIAGETSRWGRAEANESACFLTNCPEGCGAKVLFIRHNGGSVWIDPPPGWPWYKHPCMYPDEAKAASRLALTVDAFGKSPASTADLILAVATAIEFSIDWSEWRLISDERDEWRLHTNGDCRSFVGRLVVLDFASGTLTPFDRPDLVFRTKLVSKVVDDQT